MYLRLARLRRFSPGLLNDGRGALNTLYFDPDDWAVRFFLVGDDDPTFESRMVVVSPLQIVRTDVDRERVEFSLSGREPYAFGSGNRHRPLTTEEIESMMDYYGLPVFWGGTRVWGDYSSPDALRVASRGHTARAEPPVLFPHTMLMGRPVFSPDGRLGVISDLLLDISTWRIRYFIVWLQAPGETGEILLSPFWVSGPPEKPKVTVPMTTEVIVSGPNFAPEELEPLDEQILARYFGFLRE